MEATIGLLTGLLLLALTVLRPAYGVSLALCMPMIHPAIGPGASFLGAASPALLFGGAFVRALVTPGHSEQARLCFIDAALILWCAYLPVSVMMNVNEAPQVAIDSALRVVLMTFSFYASVRLLCYSVGISAFARSFVTATVAFGIFITLTALTRQESTSEFVVRLTIGNTFIGLSIYITLALVCALFTLLFMRNNVSGPARLLALVGTPLLFYGMLLCNTRSVVIALGLVCVLLLVRAVISSRLQGNVARRASFGIFVLAAAGIATAFAFPHTWARMGDKFNDLLGGSRGALGQSEAARLAFFEEALSMFSDSPILGQGIGGFEIATSSYPHNMYLEVMADMGLIGLCLLVVVSLGSVAITLKYQSLTSLLISALLVFSLFESLVSLAFWMHKNLFVFVAMAVAHHLYQLGPKPGRGQSRRRKRRRRRRRPAILGPAAA